MRLRRRRRIDEVTHRLGLHQIKLAVEHGTAGELAWLSWAGTGGLKRGQEEGILKGMYRLREGPAGSGMGASIPRVQLLGSGVMLTVPSPESRFTEKTARLTLFAGASCQPAGSVHESFGRGRSARGPVP